MNLRFQTAILSIALLLPCANFLTAQTSEYSPKISTIVSIMEDLKEQVTNSVVNLSPEDTDFLLHEEANRVGALILHLAAIEKYYQVYTFEGRDFNTAEKAQWETALNLGEDARAELVGQPIGYYLDIWEGVRLKTLALLEEKDDQWLRTPLDGTNTTNNWASYNVMEQQARYLPEIQLIVERIE